MAQPTALVAVQGVLRQPQSGQGIPEGIALYHALSRAYTVVLAVGNETDEEFDRVEGWLEEHGLMEHTAFLSWLVNEGRVAQANSLRRQGYALDLVVDPDPAEVEKLHYAGFTTVLFLHPAYSRPEWRPDFRAETPSWDSLVERVHEERITSARDSRYEADDEIKG